MVQTIPLSVPEDLLAEVRETAKATNLSVQDVFRQSTKLGLPVLRQKAAGVGSPRLASLWDVLGPSYERIRRAGDKLEFQVPNNRVKKVAP
jgi:hypothetical protein